VKRPGIQRRADCVAIYAAGTRGFAGLVHAVRFGIEVPAGTVERGETLVAAARRELYEETGLRARYLVRFGFAEDSGSRRCAVFLATDLYGRLRSSTEGEAAWFAEHHLRGPHATFARQNAEVFDRLRRRARRSPS